MKPIIATLLITIIALSSCVQKTYQKTVKYTLITNGIKGIQTAGIRGEDRPLSWKKDSALVAIVPDSIYQIIITYNTGYKFTEVKFTVDGNFEFQDADNRRINFSEGDTTYYNAIYNIRN